MKGKKNDFVSKSCFLGKWINFLILIISALPITVLGQFIDYNRNFKKDHFLQMKSPNVAMMERFDTFKVDYFNGLPEISIPLFEIKTRGFSVPITLQYHSSGVKVADVASWVGLGWNLTGQYNVGRIVKGNPDEESFLNPNFTFLTPDDLQPGTMLGYNRLRDLMPSSEGNMLFAGRDGEPDIFRYSLINKGGSFRYLKQAVPITIPYAPISIQSLYVNQANFYGFRLTDENGVRYSFGKSNNGAASYFERTSSNEGGRSGMFTSNWLVTDILDQLKKDSIQYEYYPKKNVSLFSGFGVNITVLDQYAKYYATSTPLPECTTTYPDRGSSSEQHLLKAILFENGKIEYVLSPTDRADLNIQSLSKMNVFKKVFDSYELIKTITFHQSQFQTKDNEGRLKLDSITISTPSAEKQIYRFEYNESERLPEKRSLAMDYWGYYNGANNLTGVPDTTIDYTGSSTNKVRIGDTGQGRKPDSIKVQIGILKKIIYPTGGFTNYEYESNRISQHGQIMIGGGVRIKQIKSYSSQSSAPLIRTFRYGQQAGEETGLGYVNANTQFNFLPYTTFGEAYVWPVGTLGAILDYTYRIRTFSNIMSYDQNDYDNSNVVYPFVTEYIGDDITNIGKNTYEFTYSSDLLQSGFMRVRPVSISSHWLRGQLNEKKSYKVKNGVYSLVNEESTVYGVTNLTNYPEAGVLVGSINVKSGPMEESKNYVTYTYPYHSSFYALKSGVNLPVYQSSVKYPETGLPTKSEGFYKYDSMSNISEVKEVASNKDTIYTFNKYITNFPAAYGFNNFIDLLKRSNVLTVPIEQFMGIKKSGETKPLITSALLTVYNTDNLMLKEIFKLETDKRLANFQESSFSGSTLNYDNRYRKDIEFNHYDDKNRLTEVHKIDGKYVSYQWGQFPLTPVAEITNVKNGVETKNFGMGYKQLTVSATAGNFQEYIFTVGYTGNAKLTMFQGTFLSSSNTMSIRYELTGPVSQSGSVCMNSNPNSGCYSGLESAKTANLIGLTPGTYKIKVICEATVANSTVALGFDYPTEISYSTNGKEFFYEGFENDQNRVNSNSYAGMGCYLGDYTIYFYPTTGTNYLVDYRYLSSGKWIFAKKPYTNGMTLSEGDAIDEVRIYPSNAQMTSYTYDTIFGMTSKTDPSGKTEFYNYDGLGRLKYILDQQRNILKMFDYNYINK